MHYLCEGEIVKAVTQIMQNPNFCAYKVDSANAQYYLSVQMIL